MFHLNRPKYFRPHPSTTFHGRDIFAPVAAALANGVAISEVGEAINDPVRLALPARCERAGDGTWNAAILHIDHFGNYVSNLARETIRADAAGRLVIEINGHTITKLHRCYADAAEAPGELFTIWGSAGFLELSAYRASAAQRLNVARGSEMRVTLRA